MKPDTLRNLLQKNKNLIVPGIYDALSARLAEDAGFNAVFMTGYGVSASLLGKPDIGLLTSVEMARTIAYITNAIDIPVIADADTGYGSPLNVSRTVQLYEDAGASAIQIEDQQWPKRCGHMEGKQVIPMDEMVAKILSAVEARKKNETIIIARTDAIAVEGFNQAIKRSQAYIEAGADMLFLEGPENLDQLAAIPSLLPIPHIINLAETGKGLQLITDDVWKMGYKLALFPITGLLVATNAMKKAYLTLKTNHGSRYLEHEMISYREFNSFIGMEEGVVIDERLLDDARDLIIRQRKD